MTDRRDSEYVPGPWPLWFGRFGGLVAWIIHLALGFALVYDGCALGINNLRMLVGIVTIILAAVAGAATLIAYRNWQSLRTSHIEQQSVRNGRAHFMALSGLWFSGLGLLIIVLLTIPIVWLNPCA